MEMITIRLNEYIDLLKRAELLSRMQRACTGSYCKDDVMAPKFGLSYVEKCKEIEAAVRAKVKK